MRRFLPLASCFLLSISLLPVPAAATEECKKRDLPTPADYPAAGPSCRRRVKLSSWVGTPGVDWPVTFCCVLTITTCDGERTYTSGERPGGTGMCDDYWKVHDALRSREICCDRGSPKEKRPPEAKRPPETVPKPEPPRATPPPKGKYDCTEAMNKKIEKAKQDAIDALEFSDCMERYGESFKAWRDRLDKIQFLCWDAIADGCAKAGRPHEYEKNFSRNHITIFSRNIDSCGCLHANLIHELAHTFGYKHEGPRNAYELELDCAACGK